MSFVTTNEVSVRFTKITSRIGVSGTQPTFLFLIYFQLNELWSYYQNDVNQITLNHTTL